MCTSMTVLRERPEVSTEEFRRFMEDAIVRIGFESPDAMREAYELRTAYLRETSLGIHSAVVNRTVKLA